MASNGDDDTCNDATKRMLNEPFDLDSIQNDPVLVGVPMKTMTVDDAADWEKFVSSYPRLAAPAVANESDHDTVLKKASAELNVTNHDGSKDDWIFSALWFRGIVGISRMTEC
jgi:hypothetical protein